MDYEKKYKDALARMELCVRTGLEITPEYIFSELKESDDERIRKKILEYISKATGCKEWIAWLKKQGKQNSTNSYCEENCKGYKETGKCFADGECKAKKESEQNPAWSEEDEKILGKCIDAASGYYSPEDKQSMKNWLESLKDRVQSHWKPTGEQLMALRDAIDNNEMESLYNDLKKL